MSDDALDTEDENVNPPFDLDGSMKSDVNNLAENFYEDCVLHLKRDDRVSLGPSSSQSIWILETLKQVNLLVW